MLEPGKVAARGPVKTRLMSEHEFLSLALAQVKSKPMAVFLDTAGPAGPRAEKSILSGGIRGFFIQNKEEFVFQDQTGGRTHLTAGEFSSWLNDFHTCAEGETGPALFPLITYEAFNPYTLPVRDHPLWNAGQGVWLLTSWNYVYDRAKARLSYRELNEPEGSAWKSPPRTSISYGWRETEEEYHRKLHMVQRDIFNGIYYQANLSRRFLCRSTRPPLETYQRLRTLNPSPFMGIFRFGACWVLSGSPERLVAKDKSFITARPIAGTKPRFQDPREDDASQTALLTSPKERAEHLMLVDLIRNDLGRVARPGSVHVDEFCTLETYSHVHHLVSEVSAYLHEDRTPLDLIRSMFPGGTITGAPKISCIKRLSELEGEARGPYTGSMGYLDTNQTMDLNILIRTLIQQGDEVCFHGGGGIVADSLHHAEYQETRQKCRALMEALDVDC